jgi:hypothetical protein
MQFDPKELIKCECGNNYAKTNKSRHYELHHSAKLAFYDNERPVLRNLNPEILNRETTTLTPNEKINCFVVILIQDLINQNILKDGTSKNMILKQKHINDKFY